MMRPRSLSRRLALQYLHMVDLIGPDAIEPAGVFLREHCDKKDVCSYAAGLIESVASSRSTIDQHIVAQADNWDLPRIAAVERNVLRLAVAELLAGGTPPKVVLDEAVNLAKKFGGKNSGRFVNGILDRIAREIPGEDSHA